LSQGEKARRREHKKDIKEMRENHIRGVEDFRFAGRQRDSELVVVRLKNIQENAGGGDGCPRRYS